jgi:mycothiol synthase
MTELAPDPTVRQRREALEFIDRIEAATAKPQLSDHLRLDLGRTDDRGDGGPLLTMVRTSDATDAIVGFGQVSLANESALLELVIDPDLPDRIAIRDDLAETIVRVHRQSSAHPIVWWIDEPTAHDLETGARFGLSAWRELHEMRRPLPHPDHAKITTRDFRPGIDDAAWLAVNNRAFADHPEQGGWTLDTLGLRLQEPWFDPAGFRIHERDGEIVGFCWTKIHQDSDPPVGEIYVIAVDPAAHGTGLGKQLTLAGLDSISARGVTVANLYVDAANVPAVNLYQDLGFDVHRRRVALAPREHLS